MGNKSLSVLLFAMMGVVGVIGYHVYGSYQEYVASEVKEYISLKEEEELNISIEEKMLKFFNEQDYTNVVLCYKNAFLSDENAIEPTEKAIEMYNEALFNTFNEAESIVLHDYSWLDSERIDKDVLALIKTKFKDEIIAFNNTNTSENKIEISSEEIDQTEESVVDESILESLNNTSPSSNKVSSKPNAIAVYDRAQLLFDRYTNYGDTYNPEIHDDLVMKEVARYFDVSVSEAYELYNEGADYYIEQYRKNY